MSALQPYARQWVEQSSLPINWKPNEFVIAPNLTADYVCKSLTPFRIFLYVVDLSSSAGLARMEKAENTLTVSSCVAVNISKNLVTD